jgi:phosphoserine phosphatase
VSKEALLFDFDKTLTKTDTIKFLLISLFLSDPLLGISLLKRFYGRLTDISIIKHNVINSFIQGKTVRQVSSALWLYRLLVVMSIRKTMVEKIRGCEKIIVIASASPSFALNTLKISSNVYIVATDYEIINEKYTGILNGVVCYGEEKLKRVEEFMSKKNINKIIEAYTDHYSDFPILSLAQKKYLVKPDKHTRLQATSEMIIFQ